MPQVFTNKAASTPAPRQTPRQIDRRIVIAILVVLVLALLGAGWKYFTSEPGSDPSKITKPVDG